MTEEILVILNKSAERLHYIALCVTVILWHGNYYCMLNKNVLTSIAQQINNSRQNYMNPK